MVDGDTPPPPLPPPPPPPTKDKLHPAFTVTNIRQHVRFVLDNEKVQYDHWATLFRLHANAYHVISHIDGTASSTAASDPMWHSIDSLVLQWIYATISDDLVLTILEPKQTAHKAWTRLEELFHDNQGARAAELEHEFINLRLEQCSSLDDFCTRLKTIADRLGNVGSPVSESRLVIQLTNGLTQEYDTAATLIQQTKPLPNFRTATSQLRLDAQRRNRHSGRNSSTVLVASQESGHQPPASWSPAPNAQTTNNNRNNNSSGGGRGRNNRRNNRNGGGRGGGQQGQTGGHQGQTGQPQTQQTRTTSPWPMWYPPPWFGAWTPPPCPYPTAAGWAAPPSQRGSGAGLLGSAPRPSSNSGHAFVAPGDNMFQPTDIGGAFNAMSLTPPDPSWYMDTGASSHLASNAGSSYGDLVNEEQ